MGRRRAAEGLGAGYLLPALHRLHGVALLRLHDLVGARRRLGQALALCEEQAPTERGFVLADLADLAEAEGDPSAARALRAQSRTALDGLGYRSEPATG